MREMQQVQVYVTKNGDVAIRQTSLYDDDDVVLIHPDQITTLCRWLEETRLEADNGSLPED